MLVKIIKNGVESEWFELTKKHHRALLEDKPEAAIVHIEDFYPESPDAGSLVTLEFSVFTALAREFVLMENAQDKKRERHHDKRPLDEIALDENSALFVLPEAEYQEQELRQEIEAARRTLTLTQSRRISLFLDKGLSLQRISDLEGVHITSVEESVKSAIKKIKKFLELPL